MVERENSRDRKPTNYHYNFREDIYNLIFHIKNVDRGWVWWCTAVIPPFRMLSWRPAWATNKLQASLGHIARPHLK
jgi:hypothetical protein